MNYPIEEERQEEPLFLPTPEDTEDFASLVWLWIFGAFALAGLALFAYAASQG